MAHTSTIPKSNTLETTSEDKSKAREPFTMMTIRLPTAESSRMDSLMERDM